MPPLASMSKFGKRMAGFRKPTSEYPQSSTNTNTIFGLDGAELQLVVNRTKIIRDAVEENIIVFSAAQPATPNQAAHALNVSAMLYQVDGEREDFHQ